ncbi:YadA-like family protein [Fusobacterium necrophorum subsp. funduliforme]
MLGSNIKVKENIKNSIVLGKDSTVEESDVVSIGATGKERKIVHVKEGVADTDAVNVSQLKKYSSDLEKKGLNFAGNDEVSVHRDLGQTLALKGEGVDKAASKDFKGAAGNINVKNSKNGELLLQLAEELKNIKSLSNGENKIILEGDKVVFNKDLHMGNSTAQHQIKYLADGTEDHDAVNLKQLKEYSSDLEKKGLNFAGNHGTTNKQLGDTMSIKGKEGVSEEDVQSKYDTENVVTTVDKDGNLWIKLSKNPKFNSVEAGDGETKVTIGNDGVKIGDKIYITKEGLNANNQKIVNVADGTIAQDSKDAVNGGQIHNIVQDINNSINQTNQRVDKLDDRMHRGLANSAAMATLEFLEIGINQATVGAAVGTYRGNQAVAVGVQAAPTENTRVHAKVSVAPSRNNTETMAGVGASWRFNWK